MNSDKLLYLLIEKKGEIMKNGIIFILILLCPMYLFGQERLSGVQGFLNEKGEQLFEIEGYTVSVYEMKGSLDDDATIRLIERAYQLDQVLEMYTNLGIATKNKIIEAIVNTSGFPFLITQKCILLQKSADRLIVLYLETSVKRDLPLEDKILKACLDDELARYIGSDKKAYYLTLAGKKIHLSNDAEWVSPCRLIDEKSQISWSEFSSVSRANQYLSNQITIDKAENLKYIREDDIEVIFDGKPVTAKRIIFRDRSNVTIADHLIAYYLVCELRGRYVACILSHYGYAPDDFSLPGLLTSVMRIPSVSKQSYYTISGKANETQQIDTKSDFDNPLIFEFQLGSALPVGNMRNLYKVGPLVGTYIGLPIKKKMGVDMGFQCAFPINSSFDYYWPGSREEVSAAWSASFNFRWRYQLKRIGKTFHFAYLGAGLGWIGTSIRTSEYDWETDSYDNGRYTILSADIFGGVNLRYKKLGFFIEYHFTPYEKSDENKKLGNSSINCGFSFAAFM